MRRSSDPRVAEQAHPRSTLDLGGDVGVDVDVHRHLHLSRGCIADRELSEKSPTSTGVRTTQEQADDAVLCRCELDGALAWDGEVCRHDVATAAIVQLYDNSVLRDVQQQRVLVLLPLLSRYTRHHLRRSRRHRPLGSGRHRHGCFAPRLAHGMCHCIRHAATCSYPNHHHALFRFTTSVACCHRDGVDHHGRYLLVRCVARRQRLALRHCLWRGRQQQWGHLHTGAEDVERLCCGMPPCPPVSPFGRQDCISNGVGTGAMRHLCQDLNDT
mmetsp:Transcript_42963/g.93337  ORF Transcript_42963/g.93337 Transcript_42963/m.93337 type:complete len:271 (+) Transcript_42963:571-1383(+)